jgi:hypothetical protein
MLIRRNARTLTSTSIGRAIQNFGFRMVERICMIPIDRKHSFHDQKTKISSSHSYKSNGVMFLVLIHLLFGNIFPDSVHSFTIPLSSTSSRTTSLFLSSSSKSSSSSQEEIVTTTTTTSSSTTTTSKSNQSTRLSSSSPKYPVQRGEESDSRKIVSSTRQHWTAIRLNHILFATEEMATQTLVSLRTASLAFDTLASQISNCHFTREEQGNIGWVSFQSQQNDHLDPILPPDARHQILHMKVKVSFEHSLCILYCMPLDSLDY